MAAQPQDGDFHVDQDQVRRSRSRYPCRYRHDCISTTQAQAKPLGWGIGAGLVGAAIVGTAIAASNDGYYHDGYRRCGWVRQFDAYGNYMGRVRTCGY
jgi:hypothetical protein